MALFRKTKTDFRFLHAVFFYDGYLKRSVCGDRFKKKIGYEVIEKHVDF